MSKLQGTVPRRTDAPPHRRTDSKMLLHRLYYHAKPFIPWQLRMALRRFSARRIRRRSGDVWPISQPAGKPPRGWCGWPEGKQFALVLTHDVESQRGLDRVRKLAELEMSLGFRSSFNFIPEGEYSVPAELRHWLVENGFEVGVHDLHHDGKLFHSREGFRKKAQKINSYLKEWNAAGFRSGFMMRQLDWLADLEISYDASTFDTDPFEPQPQGMNTIFPFWVPGNGESVRPYDGEPVRRYAGTPVGQYDGSIDTPAHRRTDAPPHRPTGYVELPYTLPQDSTLFLMLRERSIEVWTKKLDWVANAGGMALLDTHPDYMAFGPANGRAWEYQVALYKELLQHLRSKYATDYWHAAPREIAQLVRKSALADSAEKRPHRFSMPKPKIWIDLDNTPHVPFFEPILAELDSRGFPLLVTARDAFQVCELADKKGLRYTKVGRHHGKVRALKAAGLMQRAAQLLPLVLREKPALGVSHGARSQLLVGKGLGIPTLLIEDYEYSQFPLVMRPTWVMSPAVIPDDALCGRNGNIRKYDGIKEDVYVWKLKPDAGLLMELGIGKSDLLVTVRPPATEAHYHNPESERLFERFMERATGTPGVRLVLLPRNRKQGEFIRRRWPDWFKEDKTVIPLAALDGLNLMWHSDLVVSGGGTMNREAAALGVPVYSIFRGSIGAVDLHLSAAKRLILIESLDDVDRKIVLKRRPQRLLSEVTSKDTLQQIVDTIEEIASLAR